MPDVRWPTEWRVRGFGWVTSDELAEGQCYTVEVDVPPGDDGGPDFQGLLARLRLDPEAIEDARYELSVALEQLQDVECTCIPPEEWAAHSGDGTYEDPGPCPRCYAERLAESALAALGGERHA